MNGFRGSLTNYRLPLLVPALFDAHPFSGCLRLQRGPRERCFYISDGRLVAASSSDPHEHLAQVLVDMGVLSVTAAVAAYARATARGVPLGECLLETNAVPFPLLREALVQKAREGFFDCYCWESGDVRWEPDSPPPAVMALSLRLAPLHVDAVTVWKEWRHFYETFPDPEMAFCVSWRETQAPNPEEQQLLEQAEKGATVSALVGDSVHRIAAARLLMRLYRDGRLTPRVLRRTPVLPGQSLAEMVEASRALLSTGEYERAAQVATQALERASVPEAQSLYVEAERRLGCQLTEELLALDGQLDVSPVSGSPPPGLTAADLYLHSRLLQSKSLSKALQGWSMPQLPVYQAVRRLMAVGLLKLRPGAPARRELSVS